MTRVPYQFDTLVPSAVERARLRRRMRKLYGKGVTVRTIAIVLAEYEGVELTYAQVRHQLTGRKVPGCREAHRAV